MAAQQGILKICGCPDFCNADYSLRFCGNKKDGSGRVALDLSEKGSDDVFWALEIRLGQRL